MAAYPTIQLSESDRRIDPSQKHDIKKMKEEKKKENAFGPLPALS